MSLVKTVDVSDAASLHLRAKKGQEFVLTLTFGDGTEDLTNAALRMTAVVEKNRAGVLSITNNTDEETVGRIFGAANRTIHIIIPSEVTATWPERLCEFDIDIFDVVWQPVVSGKLIVKRQNKA